MKDWSSAPSGAAPLPTESEPQVASFDPHNDGLEFPNGF